MALMTDIVRVVQERLGLVSTANGSRFLAPTVSVLVLTKALQYV